jgi:hypothetical protein
VPFECYGERLEVQLCLAEPRDVPRARVGVADATAVRA